MVVSHLTKQKASRRVSANLDIWQLGNAPPGLSSFDDISSHPWLLLLCWESQAKQDVKVAIFLHVNEYLLICTYKHIHAVIRVCKSYTYVVICIHFNVANGVGEGCLIIFLSLMIFHLQSYRSSALSQHLPPPNPMQPCHWHWRSFLSERSGLVLGLLRNRQAAEELGQDLSGHLGHIKRHPW